MKVLIIDRVSPVIANRLEKYGVQVDTKILPSREELKAMLPNYDVLLMRVDPKIDKEMIDAMPEKMKLICVNSAGTNHIDLEYAQKRGITVQNAPGKNANAVAELTISKLLDLSRMTVEANEEVQKQGIWNKYKYTGHELKGHVLGIIGYGNIGRRVGELAQAFGMTVIAYDPYVAKSEVAARGVEPVEDLDELVRRSDYLTVHTPMTSETKGMIGEKQFEEMKEGAIVVNCARGGIIDENAALKALKSGKIAGLGFDVLADELGTKGFSSDDARLSSPLFGEKGFVITPHLGGSAYEAYDAIGNFLVDKIAEYYHLNK